MLSLIIWYLTPTVSVQYQYGISTKLNNILEGDFTTVRENDTAVVVSMVKKCVKYVQKYAAWNVQCIKLNKTLKRQ